MAIENIILISFGQFDKFILKEIFESVENEFGLPVIQKEGHLDLSEFFDTSRRQYNANILLKTIDSKYSQENAKTLGLLNIDLFIPILTFIFGQAYLGGNTGIASMYRLSNERYGILKDDKILEMRFKKEITHELGHLFGLIHCHHVDCVMRSSTYAEDIDQKSIHLCHSCKEELIKFSNS